MNKQYNYLFGLILIVTMLSSILAIPVIQSAAYDEKTTSSTATIGTFVEITLSSDLTSGIEYGALETNTNANNASGNYNASDMTTYYLAAGSANNVNIDFCIKNNQSLTSGGDTIPNTGYRYNFSATNDATHPGLTGTAITTNYVKTQHTNIAPDGLTNARFWLDVPNGQPTGTYSTLVYIKGIETGTSC